MTSTFSGQHQSDSMIIPSRSFNHHISIDTFIHQFRIPEASNNPRNMFTHPMGHGRHGPLPSSLIQHHHRSIEPSGHQLTQFMGNHHISSYIPIMSTFWGFLSSLPFTPTPLDSPPHRPLTSSSMMFYAITVSHYHTINHTHFLSPNHIPAEIFVDRRQLIIGGKTQISY